MGRAQPHAAVNALPDHRAIWDPRTLAPGFFSLSTTLRPSAEALVGRAGIRDHQESGPGIGATATAADCAFLN